MIDDEGGYVLPDGAAENLRWCREHGVVKITRDYVIDTLYGVVIKDEYHYYLADGTEIKNEVESGIDLYNIK